jgi:hypothetical protein
MECGRVGCDLCVSLGGLPAGEDWVPTAAGTFENSHPVRKPSESIDLAQLGGAGCLGIGQ